MILIEKYHNCKVCVTFNSAMSEMPRHFKLAKFDFVHKHQYYIFRSDI